MLRHLGLTCPFIHRKSLLSAPSRVLREVCPVTRPATCPGWRRRWTLHKYRLFHVSGRFFEPSCRAANAVSVTLCPALLSSSRPGSRLPLPSRLLSVQHPNVRCSSRRPTFLRRRTASRTIRRPDHIVPPLASDFKRRTHEPLRSAGWSRREKGVTLPRETLHPHWHNLNYCREVVDFFSPRGRGNQHGAFVLRSTYCPVSVIFVRPSGEDPGAFADEDRHAARASQRRRDSGLVRSNDKHDQDCGKYNSQ